METKEPVRIPKRLKQRPQWKGLPIPYIALVGEDGTPDFKVTDQHKRLSVMRNHWCQLCGEPLGRFCFFVGGIEAAKANQYFEPACHLDCLIYAMRVCPFIIGKIEHADPDKIAAKHAHEQIQVVKEVLPARNPYWVIVKASGWRAIKFASSPQIFLKPDRIKATDPLHAETMTYSDWRKVEEFLLSEHQQQTKEVSSEKTET